MPALGLEPGSHIQLRRDTETPTIKRHVGCGGVILSWTCGGLGFRCEKCDAHWDGEYRRQLGFGGDPSSSDYWEDSAYAKRNPDSDVKSWTVLQVTDAEGETRQLIDVVAAGEAAGADIDPTGAVTAWPGHFVHLPGEEPDWDTPAELIDWRGFRNARDAAKERSAD